MRRPRLFLPPLLQADTEIAVEGERAHYLRTVLRLRPGAEITVFNGKGGEFDAEIISLDRRQVRLRLGNWHAREVESPLKVHLGLAVAKGERMDWAIQKAVELGVAEVTPLLTERCNVLLKGDKAGRKRRHWQAIAVAACEQCGRNRVPQIYPPRQLTAWLMLQPPGILFDAGGAPLPILPPPSLETAVLIGPEGGMTEWEVRQAVTAGFLKASLGPRILRVETAAVAALTALQLLWGDAAGTELS